MDARHNQATVGRGNLVSRALRPATAAAGSTDTALVEENVVHQAATSDETSSDDVDTEIESTSSEGSNSNTEDDDGEEDDDQEIDGDEHLDNGGVASSSHTSDPHTASGPDDIKSRLAAFLPAMAKANQNLDHADRIDDVRDGEQYVEMNLGLGVLEEQTKGRSDILHEAASSDDSVSTTSEEEDNGDEESLNPPTAKRGKIGIEEVG